MEEMWLARDKDDRLHVYRGEKPKRFLKTWSISSFDVSPLPRQWFPEVKWSDEEPTKVKLVIDKQYGKGKVNTTKCTNANTEID